MPTKKTQTFEQSLQRLEKIVAELERGEAPLDALLALYTEGADLLRTCTKQLDAAEQSVMRVVKGADGEPTQQEFALDE